MTLRETVARAALEELNRQAKEAGAISGGFTFAFDSRLVSDAALRALFSAGPDDAAVEAAAERLFYEQHNIMHDHKRNWARQSALNQKLWRDTARAALAAAFKTMGK